MVFFVRISAAHLWRKALVCSVVMAVVDAAAAAAPSAAAAPPSAAVTACAHAGTTAA